MHSEKHNMRTFSSYIFLGLLLIYSCSTKQEVKNDLTVWVTPFIGSESQDSLSLPSNTFPGATTPFGMIQLSPDTQKDILNTCSGYQWKDSVILWIQPYTFKRYWHLRFIRHINFAFHWYKRFHYCKAYSK